MSSGKYILYKPQDDWTNSSAAFEANASAGHNLQPRADDYTTHLLRNVAELCLALPIAVLGIVGNIVSFIVLCHQRRHKLQTITILLQVTIEACLL